MFVAAFYFVLYPVRHYPNPIGWDTPHYLMQATIVGAKGLSGVPARLPPPSVSLASRAAFPVLVLSLSSLFSASTYKLAETVPVVAAMATALGAGAFVSVSLRKGARDLAVVAFLVGVSPVLIRLMAPETYSDNLFFMAVVTTALVPLMFVMRDGRGYVASVLLLTAGAIAHLPFFLAAVAVLLVVGTAFVPESWRAWRRHEAPLLSTPTGRLGVVLGGTAGLAGGYVFGLLRGAPSAPRLSAHEISKKLGEDVGLYAFPVTVPMAAAGAAHAGLSRRAGAWRERFGPRFFLVVCAAWGAVVALGVVAFALGARVPAHRFLATLVPLSVLAAVGVLAGAEWLWARGARLLGAAVLLAAVVGLTAFGAHLYYVRLPRERGVEWLELHAIQSTANAMAYLDAERVPADAPVVFVIDDRGRNPVSNLPHLAYILRSAMPADRILDSWFYVGDPGRYLAGQQTVRTRPKSYRSISASFWRPLQLMRSEAPTRPVALLLRSTNPAYDRARSEHPSWVAAPGVIVLNGPRPGRVLPSAAPPWGLRGVVEGVALPAGTLLVLTLLGLAWAVALLPPGPRSFEVLALAPGFGFALLILIGVVADSVGVRLAAWGGRLTALSAVAVGAALAARRLRAWTRPRPPS